MEAQVADVIRSRERDVIKEDSRTGSAAGSECHMNTFSLVQLHPPLFTPFIDTINVNNYYKNTYKLLLLCFVYWLE